jgi:LysR family transcriptional regulator, regulator for metE and metH
MKFLHIGVSAGVAPRLEIKHLIVLCGLSDTGSVTATAARLGLTQSAVSHRLREAERRIGIPLSERHERGVRLTTVGEQLRAMSDGFLQELGRVELELRETAAAGHRVVRLGQSTYSRYHWLPAFLDYVAAENPTLRVDLSGTAASRPFAALNARTADVVSVYGREISPGRYRWRKLGTDPLVAVVAPSHRFAQRRHLDSEDIAGERYFAYPLSAEPGFEWESLIGAPRVPFRLVTQMPTPEAVIDLVRTGFGVGVFSSWAVQPEVADGTLVALPIGSAGMELDWWAVTRADEDANSSAEQLAQLLVSWGGRLQHGLDTLAIDTPNAPTV